MQLTKTKPDIIKKVYLLSFFVLCFYQILAALPLLSILNIELTSVILRWVLMVALFLILKEFLHLRYYIYLPKNMIIYIFIIFSLLAHLLYYSFFFDEMFDRLDRSSVVFTKSFIMGSISWMFLGSAFYLTFRESNFHVVLQKSIFKFPYISILLLYVFFISNNGFNEIDYLLINDNASTTVSHLTLGSFIIYLLIYSQVLSKGYSVYITLLCNILILYMIGGRSDILIYIITSTIYYSYFLRNSRFTFLIFTLVSFVSVLCSLALITGFSKLEFISEISSVFTDQDSSKQARIDFMISNLKDLPNKIVFGNPNYLIEAHGSLGTYTHNLLSIWEFFGFLTFSLILTVIIIILKFIIHNRYVIIEDNSGRIFILIFIFSSLSVLLTKSAFYYPFWFAFGFSLMYMSIHHKSRS